MDIGAATGRKVAVVTGGERGIGLGITQRLLSDGWRVVVGGLDDAAAGASLAVLGEDVIYVRCDVADEASVAALMQASVAWGGGIDGLVLNAGIASPARVDLGALSLADWQRVLDVNLTGAFLCAKHARAALRAARGGIVAIASTRATMSEADTFAYSASKGGLVALVHSLAISLGPEIRANAISPGWVHTGDLAELRVEDHAQHPVGRVGLAADIAGLAAYLLGAESGFVTGQDFVVDGGMTRKMVYVP